jgi:uncharacterized protein YbcI
MDRRSELHARIADVVATFGKNQMSAALELVSVSLQPNILVITLSSVTCPAEKDLAREQRGRTLLANLYSRAFDSVKQHLESHIEQILERHVTGSSIVVEPESGNGIMSFGLAEGTGIQIAEAS